MKAATWKKWTGHLFLWSLYLLADYLANRMHYPPWNRDLLFRNSLLSLPFMMGTTYLITEFLVPRFLLTRRLWTFWIGIVVLALGLYVARSYWVSWIIWWDEGTWTRTPPPKIFKNVIRDYAVVGFAVCLQIITDWHQKDRQNQQLRTSKAEIEIALLKAQLHPHFLFNTLNNLYGLALRQSTQVAPGILKLSELLDYTLYHGSKEWVPLRQELRLVQHYMHLEQMRYGDKLFVNLEEEIAANAYQIAPLILLPFVENCFKHGRKGTDGLFRVNGRIWEETGKLHFQLRNSIGPQAAQQPGGIGIANIRQRLALIYPENHQLQVQEDDGFYQIYLAVPLHPLDIQLSL